jgi:hypothetical protein
MASLAEQIQADDTCGPDLKMENPIVMQAYRGFSAYQPLYHAGCLPNDDQSGNDNSSSSSGGGSAEYCYANAVTDSLHPESSYIYFLPLGVSLPGGSRPDCTTCLKNTMAIFANFVSDSQALKGTYVGAAEQVQMNCGPSFAEASVQVTGAGGSNGVSWVVGVATVVVSLMGMW